MVIAGEAFLYAMGGFDVPDLAATALSVGGPGAHRMHRIVVAPSGAAAPIFMAGNEVAVDSRTCEATALSQGFLMKVVHPEPVSPWPDGCGPEPSAPLFCPAP